MELLTGILRGLLGIVAFIGITYLFSTNKKAIDWGLVVKGLALQMLLALILINPFELGILEYIRMFFRGIVDFFVLMITATEEASK